MCTDSLIFNSVLLLDMCSGVWGEKVEKKKRKNQCILLKHVHLQTQSSWPSVTSVLIQHRGEERPPCLQACTLQLTCTALTFIITQKHHRKAKNFCCLHFLVWQAIRHVPPKPLWNNKYNVFTLHSSKTNEFWTEPDVFFSFFWGEDY